MDLKEKYVNTRDWINVAQDRDYWGALECGIDPLGFINHGAASNICLH